MEAATGKAILLSVISGIYAGIVDCFCYLAGNSSLDGIGNDPGGDGISTLDLNAPILFLCYLLYFRDCLNKIPVLTK